MNNIKREAGKRLRNKKREYLKGKIEEVATKSWN
jgi:hypothetical protein